MIAVYLFDRSVDDYAFVGEFDTLEEAEGEAERVRGSNDPRVAWVSLSGKHHHRGWFKENNPRIPDWNP